MALSKEKVLRILKEFKKGFLQDEPEYVGKLDPNADDYAAFYAASPMLAFIGGLAGMQKGHKAKGIEEFGIYGEDEGQAYGYTEGEWGKKDWTGEDKLKSFVFNQLPLMLLGTYGLPIAANLSDRTLTGLGAAKAGWKDEEYVHPEEIKRRERLLADSKGIIPSTREVPPESIGTGYEHGHGEVLMDNIKELLDVYDPKEKPEDFQSFFNLLKEHGYNAPRSIFGVGDWDDPLLPSTTAGRYLPDENAMLFSDKDPDEGIALHELTHYLDFYAGEQETKPYISKSTLKDYENLYGKRMYPAGNLYAQRPLEMIARLAGASGGALDPENRLVGMIGKSAKGITDKSEDKGTHKDILDIISDIETYHGMSSATKQLWEDLPFEHKFKQSALDQLQRSILELKEEDRKNR